MTQLYLITLEIGGNALHGRLSEVMIKAVKAQETKRDSGTSRQEKNYCECKTSMVNLAVMINMREEIARRYDDTRIGGILNAFALGALIGSAFFAAGVGYSIYSGSKTGMHVGLSLHAIVTITISIIKGRMNRARIQALKSSVNL